MKWHWDIRVANGDFDAAGISAEPADVLKRRPVTPSITNMYTNIDHDVVVEFAIVAEDRTTAIEQARNLYDEQVPADMRRG